MSSTAKAVGYSNHESALAIWMSVGSNFKLTNKESNIEQIYLGGPFTNELC